MLKAAAICKAPAFWLVAALLVKVAVAGFLIQQCARSGSPVEAQIKKPSRAFS
jgi:hypothetical protein